MSEELKPCGHEFMEWSDENTMQFEVRLRVSNAYGCVVYSMEKVDCIMPCSDKRAAEDAFNKARVVFTRAPDAAPQDVREAYSPMQRQALAEKIARYFAGYSFSRHEAAQCLGLVDVLIADGTLVQAASAETERLKRQVKVLRELAIAMKNTQYHARVNEALAAVDKIAAGE